ncbi:nucleotide pyrophosphohydrolase [Salinirubrum litoreum]|uniref:Nucleotide pyrophosphohydrolase n=1 Tax=Salinirubrum litoreum TaxID=1126234 RepID=A0ABD5RBW9_9EURY|nr:nucleotide pyrophosphohydrolase [Salinirubrum litoreum]
MTDLEDLQLRYEQFVAQRNWEQFHTPKNLAEAISVEASELVECFLWHDNLKPDELQKNENLVTDVEEELADIVIYCLGMATRLDIDLLDAVEAKLEDNEQRFDPEKTDTINEELSQWQRENR